MVFGFSVKKIVGSFFMLTAMVDLISFRYNPERGSGVAWTFNRLVQFRNTSHRLAEAICNKPDECKNYIDEVLKHVPEIPQDVWAKIAESLGRFTEFMRNLTQAQPTEVPHDDGTRKRFALALNYSNKAKVDVNNGEALLNSLSFSSYDENNLCDFKEGIPPEEYDDTVDEIADLTNMPEKVKKVIKRAKNFKKGNVLAVNKLGFKAEDGTMVFGRVAVSRNGEYLDMAYSLHSLSYDLSAEQASPKTVENLKTFSDSLEDGGENTQVPSKIPMALRNDFQAFFENKAIEGFVKHCGFVLKAIKDEGTQSDILREIGVLSGEDAAKGKA